MINPIYQENGKWYFWDETWGNSYGPYNTLEEAQKALKEYFRSLNPI
jgi:hypothetical protein